ncbi:MAG TPA: hypothetical protein PLX18_04275 [Anaerohalosphaeraceae bacterium]|nr:hypothetical protein [Anaerohalosphaeraceae bacterium]HQG05691.1 hypothetical protein [Anaerohalosphaeraceae bacterium]HQI07064.1 hypothetical protein [Anaerohalosphaeraceae bacterium]HQJ67006.1 hypothetical protein [Anaerohalosphaeraceae bacterium]
MMDFIKAFLKKYSALLLPAGLLLAGLIFFVPILLLGRTISVKKQNWEKMASDLDRLAQTTPPKEQAEQVKRVLQQLQEEVKAVQTMALQTTQRELIKYGIFPKSEDTSSQIYLDFGRRYRAAVESMITTRLKALDAPSEAEIRAAGGGVGGVGGVGGIMRGGEYLGAGMTAAPGAASLTDNPMVNALCMERAERIAMYANPRVFAWYDFWESFQFLGADLALRDCWFAQTAYWIYEDVAATVETMNTGSARVADSPVKRLLGVSFQRPVSDLPTGYSPLNVPRGMGTFTTGLAADQPAYILPGMASPLGTLPWTTRMCNEDIDVVHFAVSVIVDSRFTQAFLKELCSSKPHTYREGFQENGPQRQARHNQITILASTFSAIDKQSPTHMYYRYGTDAVMRVDLVCEYLFYRKAYDMIKPEPIKVLLGQSANAPLSPGVGM